MSNSTETFFDSGNTAWLLTSTGFVFFQVFGLAIFYASIVGRRFTVTTLLETIAPVAVVTIQWVLFGYSFAFADDSSSFFGSFQYAGLKDIAGWQDTSGTREINAPTLPAALFVAFQLSFAILTASLLAGSVVGKMKFVPFLAFIFMWTTIVYDPIAHWCWSVPGWLKKLGTLDFAGGSVVHINAGFSALAMSIVVAWGRRNKPKPKLPDEPHHSLNLLGAGILWTGWFGFNGGSSLAADQVAAIALLNTMICPASSMFFWMCCEMILGQYRDGKPNSSLDGPLFGAICGLVVITPCAGFVQPGYAVLIGIYTAVLCFTALWGWKWLSSRTRIIDDSLYVFVSHGLGGVIGAFTTGLFADATINPYIPDGAFYGRGVQIAYQLADIASVASWAFVVTGILMLALKFTVGVNRDDDDEDEAIDSKDIEPSPRPRIGRAPTLNNVFDRDRENIEN